MRLCSYIVPIDSGLAPNPFWGHLTLAVCTPNHMGIRAQAGDWFVGFTSARRGHRLLYAMEVSEALHFDDYFRDERFQQKKPAINAPWRKRCGDNIYYLDDEGSWQQHPTPFHTARKQVRQDTKNPYVFIAEHFYYFGQNAQLTPGRFHDLVWPRQGVKCRHDHALVEAFLRWLQAAFTAGIHGEPHDRPRKLHEEGGK